jgi:hypothetical protein
MRLPASVNSHQLKIFLANKRAAKTLGLVNRALLDLLAAFVVLALGESPEPTKVRVTTWNLEWFPNGSAHDVDRSASPW